MGFVVYLFGAPRIYFSKRPPLTYLNTSPVNRGDRKEWESLSWGSDQNQFSNIFHPIQPLNKKNFWGRDRRRRLATNGKVLTQCIPGFWLARSSNTPIRAANATRCTNNLRATSVVDYCSGNASVAGAVIDGRCWGSAWTKSSDGRDFAIGRRSVGRSVSDRPDGRSGNFGRKLL